MASIAEQITTLKNKINNVYTLVDGVRQAGALYPTLGNLVTFGCAVAISDSTTVTFQDDDHVNPDKESPVVGGRTETYPNIALVYGEVFTSDNTTASIDGDNLPSATYSRYDLLYVYVNSSGSNIAIATGTPTTGTPTDPTVPAGSMTIARLTVDSTGITAATDLRNFDSRIDYVNATLTGIPTAPTAANGTDTTQLATTEFVQNAIAPFGKNLLINGDMSVWQRATSATITSNGYVYNSVDRWQFYYTDTTITKSYQVYNGTHMDAMQIAHTGTGYAYCMQKIERGAIRISGKNVTVSFVGAATSGVASCNFELSLKNDSGTTLWSMQEAFTLTSSSAYYSATFVVDDESAGSILNGIAQLRFTTSATGASTILLSNVQLEIGSKATAFEIVDPATQLARCKRYYNELCYQDVTGAGSSIPVCNGSAFNVTQFFAVIRFQEMRIIPAASFSAASKFGVYLNTASQVPSAVFASTISANAADVVFAGTYTAGQAGYVKEILDGASIALDAEII